MEPTDDTAAVFDVISEDVDRTLPKSAENTNEEQSESTEPTNESTPEEPVTGQETESTESTAEENSEPSQKETQSEKSQTEAEVIDWKSTLPPKPVLAEIPFPERDENGQVDPVAYENYLIAKAEQRITETMYGNHVENVALEAAEKLLPEIKTNPVVRKLVENQRIAQVVNGEEGDVVSAAQAIKQLLGGAKAEGANNAKNSITIQKNAALETGASQTKSEPSRGQAIADRINKGDEEAFVELIDLWQEEGYIK